MDQERFQRQLDFILELDKEKNILRQTHLTGHGRRENDAEHAWHLAVMAYLLREYANDGIDIARTMAMLLIHDVVEIDAGDTYAYDEEAKQSQREREEKAADRLFGMLPEDQGSDLRAMFEEFEAARTPEARFARAMDNFQPMLLNHANGGSDWVGHQVKRSQIEERNRITPAGSAAIWEYMQSLVREHLQSGQILEG